MLTLLAILLYGVLAYSFGFVIGTRNVIKKFDDAIPTIPEISIDKNNKFILNGEEYELIEDANYEDVDDYDIIHVEDVDAFGVPNVKKEKKLN